MYICQLSSHPNSRTKYFNDSLLTAIIESDQQHSNGYWVTVFSQLICSNQTLKIGVECRGGHSLVSAAGGVRGAGGSVQAPSPKPRCPSGAKAPLIPSSPHDSAPALRGRSRRSPHESVLVPAHLVSPCSPSSGPAPAMRGRNRLMSQF